MVDPKLLEEALRNVYLKKFGEQLREMMVFSKNHELAEVYNEYLRLLKEKKHD